MKRVFFIKLGRNTASVKIRFVLVENERKKNKRKREERKRK